MQIEIANRFKYARRKIIQPAQTFISLRTIRKDTVQIIGFRLTGYFMKLI